MTIFTQSLRKSSLAPASFYEEVPPCVGACAGPGRYACSHLLVSRSVSLGWMGAAGPFIDSLQLVSLDVLSLQASIHVLTDLTLVCAQSLCYARLFATPWTAHHVPLTMGFFRQEYWSGFPFPPSGDLPNPGIKPMSLTSPVLVGRFFTSATWETP